jgi:quercetin dioxygenase-like cupin family protein
LFLLSEPEKKIRKLFTGESTFNWLFNLKYKKMYREKTSFITESMADFNNRLINSPLNSSELGVMINHLKQEPSWGKGDLKSAILLKSPSKKVLLTVLHAGTIISSFQSDDSITFQVIEGMMNLHFRNESFTLNKGEVLIMNEKLKYEIDTQEDSAFIMILASGGQNNKFNS